MEFFLAFAIAGLAYLAFRGIRVATADNNATVNDLDSIWGAIQSAQDDIVALQRRSVVAKKVAKKKGSK